jgi:hypothetical protein
MNIKPYIDIARPDHWAKNIFIIPGVLIAVFFMQLPWSVIVSLPVIGADEHVAFVWGCVLYLHFLDESKDQFYKKGK